MDHGSERPDGAALAARVSRAEEDLEARLGLVDAFGWSEADRFAQQDVSECLAVLSDRGFAGSVRKLTGLTRKRALIDSCEVRFLSSWELALEALMSVEVDMRGACFMGASLRRAGLPPGVCRAILEFATAWPQLAGDGKARKRRRVAR